MFQTVDHASLWTDIVSSSSSKMPQQTQWMKHQMSSDLIPVIAKTVGELCTG